MMTEPNSFHLKLKRPPSLTEVTSLGDSEKQYLDFSSPQSGYREGFTSDLPLSLAGFAQRLHEDIERYPFGRMLRLSFGVPLIRAWDGEPNSLEITAKMVYPSPAGPMTFMCKEVINLGSFKDVEEPLLRRHICEKLLTQIALAQLDTPQNVNFSISVTLGLDPLGQEAEIAYLLSLIPAHHWETVRQSRMEAKK